MNDQPQTRKRRPRLVASKNLPNPSAYVMALTGEYSEWAYDEQRALLYRGAWRRQFGLPIEHSLDLEIGTGNGYFFAHRALSEPGRALIGLELKFKPLIQSIRRALRGGARNAKIVRYDASCLEDVFAPQELNNVFIHHPDPWPRPRDHKHRLIQPEFLERLYSLMRPGSFVNFKTDFEDYYDWALPMIQQSKFKITRQTRDLHQSDWADENFVTQFEQLFLQKGQAIFYCRFEK